MTLDEIMAVYQGSNADATRALYRRLLELSPRGFVAVKLLQACKASERAKTYSGGRWTRAAYDKKDWAIGELCSALALAFPEVIESWGWGLDPKAVGFENVLYVDIPGGGQVSFHTQYRRDGPNYGGRWDGAKGQAPLRICRWAEAILDGRELSNEGGGDDGVPAGTEGAAAEGAEGGEVRQAWRQEALDL